VAQSEESCVVSGMPRAAISKGYASRVVPLEGLSSFLIEQCGVERASPEKAGVSSPQP